MIDRRRALRFGLAWLSMTLALAGCQGRGFAGPRRSRLGAARPRA